MSNHLIIEDLNYLVSLEELKISGAGTSAYAYTAAGESALAYAAAGATGWSTNTSTRTLVAKTTFTSSTFSYAKADANAMAYTGITEKSSYRSTSIYYSDP